VRVPPGGVSVPQGCSWRGPGTASVPASWRGSEPAPVSTTQKQSSQLPLTHKPLRVKTKFTA